MSTAKKCLIVGAVLLLLGCCLAFGARMAAGNWDFASLQNAKMETNTVEISDDFRSISIRSDTEDVVFVPSDDGSCRVVFYEWENEKHTASVQDGTLTIERIDSREWYEHVRFSLADPRITVYLPQGDYGALSIEESTGDVELPGDFSFAGIEITVSTGDVRCCASATGPIRITASTGSIKAEELSAEELALSVSTGRVEVSSVACAGELSVGVSTGKTHLTDVSCQSFTSHGSTGDVTMENVLVTETVTIERSTGDVKFDDCDAGELCVKTDTGDVSGTLLSDKVFIVQSDTGRVEVPETTSGGKCKIVTDTGDIRIRIG